MIGAYFIGILFMVAGLIIGGVLRSKFKKYSEIPVNGGLTGKDIAERMLAENGIYDVQVISVGGQLTDHYNPMNKTINLSEGVYNVCSIAAAAVAAHETGHAVQHARQYSWLQMRSKMVPVVSISSQWLTWVLLAGILLINSYPQILLAGIVMFALTTLFSFITLPVEIDASRRAIAWLQGSSVAGTMEMSKAKDALNWAGYTYVVAALGSLATLLYYVMIYMSRR
ncbi:MAG TPA: zinc metallopeptidase [Chitinophagales bacterium]|nr:zinc metallopeptidase [Chitinophagales bacterium]HMX04038.1 zinc metallopeptidase [Chitinophagales bacterium]HMZ87908.1 zinc metallopeptidase [Chitinophagales bacterium]HNA57943.1 zinc metallopeptidase [Chitinophagales bacterium]HNE47250.1 zinc metallopeptidase [Chitinophagales bacterium]